MARAGIANKADARSEYRRQRVAEHEGSGLSVPQFCQQHGLTGQSFYVWRKRLRRQEPMRFALVETPAARQAAAEPALELALASGERLRIGAGVDAQTLRTVLEALRA
jgi:transposase-like protein